MGRTEPTGSVAEPLEPGSAATASAVGTYLHGLFENEAVRDAFAETVFERTDRVRPARETEDRSPYDDAAALVADLADALVG
jgi:adenosylcobyric acid synthase